MSRHVSDKLTAEVVLRAENRCEYCRIAIEDTYFGSEIDHIRSLKHGGVTTADNLALQPCNRRKGTDLGSIGSASEELVRFFNPRLDNWHEHFACNASGEIHSLTEIAEVTARILGFNIFERVQERAGLIELGRFEI